MAITFILFFLSSFYLYHSFKAPALKPYRFMYISDGEIRYVRLGGLNSSYTFTNTWSAMDVVVYDLDGNGRDDIVLAASTKNDHYEAILLAIKGSGRVIWVKHFSIDAPIAGFRGLAGSYYDSLSDFVIFFFTGDTLYAFSSLGSLLWSVVLEPSLFSPVLGDIDGDGVKEIVFAGLEHVYVLEPLSGDLVFSVNVSVMKCFPVIGDVDGDGLSEIVLVARNYTIIALDSSGGVEWRLDLNETDEFPFPPVGFISMVDVDSDGILDIIGVVDVYRVDSHSGLKVFYINGASHELAFSYEFEFSLSSSPAVLVKEGNIYLMIYGLDTLLIFAFDRNGFNYQLRIENAEAPNIYNPMMLMDVDNDSLLEVYLPHYGGFSLVDFEDRLIRYYELLPIELYNDFSFVGDFDGDRAYEVGFIGFLYPRVGYFDLPSGFRVYWRGPSLNENNFNLALIDGDFDGLSDFSESFLGTNASDPDSDGDGLPDVFEVEAGLDPLDDSDGGADFDGDGLSNVEEYVLGTDVFVGDSDGDFWVDGVDPYPKDSLRPALEIWLTNFVALIALIAIWMIRELRKI